MNSLAPAAAILLVLAALAGACLPGRGVPGSDTQEPRRPDSVAVLVDNMNYLAVTVRLYSRGAQVRRISVSGNNADTLYMRPDQLHMPGQISAILELVGSREAYRLREEILPVDATLIEIRVGSLLSTSSLSIF